MFVALFTQRGVLRCRYIKVEQWVDALRVRSHGIQTPWIAGRQGHGIGRMAEQKEIPMGCSYREGMPLSGFLVRL